VDSEPVVDRPAKNAALSAGSRRNETTNRPPNPADSREEEEPRATEDDGEVQDIWIRRWKDEGGAWLPTD
jgi:hypothetical protein